MNIEIAPKETEILLTWSEAKFYCQMLSIDGKTDWRLPTTAELEYIYNNRHNYDFQEYFYWSSMVGGHGAFALNFFSGNKFEIDILYCYATRAIRDL